MPAQCWSRAGPSLGSTSTAAGSARRPSANCGHRVHTVVETPAAASPAAEAQGIAISMIVAEVEPIGGFVGESVSEPLLQIGIMLSVLAYLIHIDPWMALAAFGLFIPQFVFVPLLQTAVNRRTGARIQVLRRLGIAMIDRNDGAEDDRRIDEAFALDMGIFKLKFTMNFLMNACNHLQRISAFLVGGWWVYTGHLEIGGVVAFISGIGRLNDPWGDLVNYFRDVNLTQIKYRMLADAVNQLAPAALDRTVPPLSATAGYGLAEYRLFVHPTLTIRPPATRREGVENARSNLRGPAGAIRQRASTAAIG